jgi:hypothetical protein
MQNQEDRAYTRDEAIKSLLADNTPNSCLLKTLYKELADNPSIALYDSFSQFKILFSNANFAESEDERVYVASVFARRIFDKDIIPQISEHCDCQLAEKGLVTLSFFRDYLERRRQRFGAPSIEFYERVSVDKLKKIGRPEVAEHLKNWTDYAQSVFLL